jgi:predicted transcriptional regulator
MAKKEIKTIQFGVKKGRLRSIISYIPYVSGEEFGISNLRQLLSNEKVRILHVIKQENPVSIYKLARLLGRDFKAVYSDVKLLEHAGFIELEKEVKKGKKRTSLRPVLKVTEMQINIKV